MISNTEKVSKILNMMIKGWAKSGVVPPPELSEDGVSVGFAGMTWLTVLDSFKLFNIEDTSLIDDIEAVRKASAKILDDQRVVSETELEEIAEKEEANDKP